MKKLISKTLMVTLILSGFLFQACEKQDSPVKPEPQPSVSVSDDQIAEVVAMELSKTASACGTSTVINDFATMAKAATSEGTQDYSYLIGLISNDSTITYEGDTYSTTITYEVDYKVGNNVMDDYTPLADTALISYAMNSTIDNIQFYAEREAHSNLFEIWGIRPPTNEFIVQLETVFHLRMDFKTYSMPTLFFDGKTTLKDIVLNILTMTIESGTGKMEFTVSTESHQSKTIVVEIEFIGNNKATIKFNGKEYTVNLNLGILVP